MPCSRRTSRTSLGLRSSFVGLVGLLAAATSLTASSEAAAWNAASTSGPLYGERYLVCSSHGMDFHCFGPSDRGAIVRALDLSVAPARPSGDGGTWIPSTNVDRFHDAAHLAAASNVVEAIPNLRRALDVTIQESEQRTHAAISKNGVRVEAAEVLAWLGDGASAPRIETLVRELETTGSGSYWQDALDALGRLDPARAGRYGTEFLTRQKDVATFQTSLPGGSSRTGVLQWIKASHEASALTPLRDLTDAATGKLNGVTIRESGAWCQLSAMRFVLGDEPFTRKARHLLDGNASGTMAATCDAPWLGSIPARDEDVPLFLRWMGRPDQGTDFATTTVAYRRILELLASMREREIQAGGKTDPKAEAARTMIRKELLARNGWPFVVPVAGGYLPTIPHLGAMHSAGLAATGDPGGERRLWAILDDETEHSGAAWVGAFWALSLHVPGAVEHAAALVRRGVEYSSSDRGEVIRSARTRTTDLLLLRADPGDVRWTVALLDPERVVREHAFVALTRQRDLPIAKVCSTVTRAAAKAERSAVDEAFTSLGVFGQACAGDFERTFRDPAQSAAARGSALEMLAILRMPNAVTLANDAVKDRALEPYGRRAILIANAPR